MVSDWICLTLQSQYLQTMSRGSQGKKTPPTPLVGSSDLFFDKVIATQNHRQLLGSWI